MYCAEKPILFCSIQPIIFDMRDMKIQIKDIKKYALQ